MGDGHEGVVHMFVVMLGCRMTQLLLTLQQQCVESWAAPTYPSPVHVPSLPVSEDRSRHERTRKPHRSGMYTHVHHEIMCEKLCV